MKRRPRRKAVRPRIESSHELAMTPGYVEIRTGSGWQPIMARDGTIQNSGCHMRTVHQ